MIMSAGLAMFAGFCGSLSFRSDCHRQLLRALAEVQEQWRASRFTGTYVDAKGQSSAFTTYKQTTKRIWVTERQDVTTLFGNIQTKLRTYGLREYVPPVGLAPSVSRAETLTIRRSLKIIRI